MKTQPKKSRAKRHSELEKQALSRPGIAELMIIYNHWKQAHKEMQKHQDIKDQSYTITPSDSSIPKFHLLER